MASYQFLLFDLDHTLWDFESNSTETLVELHDEFELSRFEIEDVERFVSTYKEINAGFWKKYRAGIINKEYLRVRRFTKTFEQFGLVNRHLAVEFGDRYIELCPTKTRLMPGAENLLDHLHGKYEMCIVTNGFSETQDTKMKSSGLNRYFDVVVSSEMAGAKKPDPRIFKKTLQILKADPGSCLMIGDNLEADIEGARIAGIDQVFYNPHRTIHNEIVTYEIEHLEELRVIL